MIQYLRIKILLVRVVFFCDETGGPKATWGEEGFFVCLFVFSYNSISLFILKSQGNQSRNRQSHELMQKLWRRAAYWLAQPAFKQLGRTTAQGVPPLTLGWALPHGSLNKKKTYNLT